MGVPSASMVMITHCHLTTFNLAIAHYYVGMMFLVTVDAHSKWIDTDIADTVTSSGTI